MRTPIRIVSAEEAEQADFCVCMRVGDGDMFRFDDNLYGKCADCGHAIYFRPYNPKRPTYICAPCALGRAEALVAASKDKIKPED